MIEAPFSLFEKTDSLQNCNLTSILVFSRQIKL